MGKLIELKCTYCKSSFNRELRFYNNDKRRAKGNYHPFCSTKCRALYASKKIEVICKNCGKKIFRTPSDLTRGYDNAFCGSSCSASFHNEKRKENGFSTKNKKKQALCIKCNNQIEVSIHAQSNTYYCKDCKPKKKRIGGPHKCIVCSNINVPFFGKYCDECRSLVHQKTACKTAAKRKDKKRSKNEILFGSLCEERYKNITFNQAIFNNWDADILLYDYKLAIHWNGAWHYKFCGGKHKLGMVQNRDNIKYKEVEKYGWTNYIIKDMGKANEKLVRTEFEKLVKYINEHFDVIE